MRIIKRCEGSLIVDAAISLPIFLIAMGLLMILLMQAGTEDTVVRAAVSAAQVSVAADAASEFVESASDTAQSVLQGASYAAKLHLYLAKEWDSGPAVYIAGFATERRAMVSASLQADHLVYARVLSRRKALFSLPGTDGIDSVRSFVFRPWKGESAGLFEDDGERVYVFPKYGERYHAEGCHIMKEGSVEAILTESLKRRCSACKTCKPSSLPYGSVVFLFSDSSRIYHRKECPSITKYYVSIPKCDAQAEGYTPCQFCMEAP